jgi:anti-sigma regulatory factor (Ser/Thr protein kinase)
MYGSGRTNVVRGSHHYLGDLERRSGVGSVTRLSEPSSYPWPLRSHLELGVLPTAVPCARLHARHVLQEWGLSDLAQDTELLVSELMTNAVTATARFEDQPVVRLQLSGDSARVLIEVWDADPRPPVSEDLGEDDTPDPEEEGGRGPFLVAALSARWDWYLTQQPFGKVTWCELDAGPSEPSDDPRTAQQPSLPRRVSSAQEVQPVEATIDPEVLRRIRDRLRELELCPGQARRGRGEGNG